MFVAMHKETLALHTRLSMRSDGFFDYFGCNEWKEEKERESP